jgi:hypothetical protein
MATDPRAVCDLESASGGCSNPWNDHAFFPVSKDVTDGCFMPGQGDYFGETHWFGVKIRFAANRPDLRDAALALCPSEPAPPQSGRSIRIALTTLAPDSTAFADSFSLGDGRLTQSSSGVRFEADGPAGEGCCDFPAGALPGPDTQAAEMLTSLILFLVAQAGRTPLHASAVMLGETAIVLAGRSGSGKSALALAADRAGFPILSDDTLYVQTEPALRIWARPHAIHVFEKDAPSGAGGGMRYRSGRWKRALPITKTVAAADRALLCVLVHGDKAGLEPMPVDEVVAMLTDAPEPGYDFYGACAADAVRALAHGGCWRLTLSADPADAIALLRGQFSSLSNPHPFHQHYVALVDAIEQRFNVACWRLGDMALWPLARFALYCDLHRAAFGGFSPARRALPLRLAGALLRPLRNRWVARHDRLHQHLRPSAADAILMGDGVSLDQVHGAFQDRFGEPVITALERQGKNTFLMQPGDLSRLPWRRSTFAVNVIESRAMLASLFSSARPELPQHEEVLAFLSDNGITAPSLSRAVLIVRARRMVAAARFFGQILKRVRPRMAFVVNAMAGLAPAFVLACRRNAILCVELQRSPRAAAPMAYGWSRLPPKGYSTLPAVFWTWAEREAPALPPSAFHRDLHGGHTQLAAFLDAEATMATQDDSFHDVSATPYVREILVALQPFERARPLWDALARVIETSPPSWRWWLRRHPAMRPHQDAAFGRLLTLGRPQVIIDPPLSLPALLRRMSVLVSLASGAAIEAAAFDVPTLFLSREASAPFSDLLLSGMARIVGIVDLTAAIAALPAHSPRKPFATGPSLEVSLANLETMAADYAQLCAMTGS